MDRGNFLRAVMSASVLFAFACSTPSGPERPTHDSAGTLPSASAIQGRLVFRGECASCHASSDSFDLAYFSYPDSTVVRRALAHVDSMSASDIVAYLKSVGPPGVDRHRRMFQPGALEVSDDVAFAVALFGSDAWPDSVSGEEVSQIDPRSVRVALRFPTWSSEYGNLDWMPDDPVPAEILDFNSGVARAAIEAYYANGSSLSLLHAMEALRRAERAERLQSAPCLLRDRVRFRHSRVLRIASVDGVALAAAHASTRCA